MRVLVTGGAGYIGAHVVRLLRDRGDEVFVVDDLVNGDAARIPDVPLMRLDLSEPGATEALTDHVSATKIDAVIHLAARKSVAESVSRPTWYYQQNIGGLVTVMDAVAVSSVGRLVFSSSASVYGNVSGLVAEGSSTVPLSAYGSTKLAGEWLVADAARATGLSAISLRYFNVAGAGWPELGDRIAANLVPMVFERIEAGESPEIFGDDYDTPDGTCVRDYVHVLDLATAHLAALDSLGAQAGSHRTYNVGTGVGTSVREMIEVILSVAGSDQQPVVRPRRPGDPADVVAAVDRIGSELGWTSRHTVREIVESAWKSHQHFGSAH